MSEAAKTRRRWTQFSLRALFVAVTLCACVLAYYSHWARARQGFIDGKEFNGIPYAVSVLDTSDPLDDPFNPGYQISVQPLKAPGLLRLLGEHGYSEIDIYFGHSAIRPNEPAGCVRLLRETTREEEVIAARTRRLFPEAEVRYDADEHFDDSDEESQRAEPIPK